MSHEATRRLLAELVGLHHTGRCVDEAHKQAARRIEQHHATRAEALRKHIRTAGTRDDDLEQEYLDSVREAATARQYGE